MSDEKKNPPNLAKSDNIPWITGLRAFSFIAIFIYHLNPRILPNGYLGVDIFFVISGFVITKNLTDKWNHKYLGNFLSFYYGRIRRIIPTLYIALTVISFVVIVDPSRKVQSNFKDPVTWILTSTSNFFYWTRTNYFSDDQSVQPWIHTWSLGIEEQFYFIFPFMFIFALYWNKRIRVVMISIATVIGIIASYIVSNPHPTATFYLLPFRFWEFIIGCLAWELSRKESGINKDKAKKHNSTLEIILFSITILILTGNFSIPNGILIEVMMTLLILIMLVNGPEKGIVKYSLQSKYLVWIGSISYQLYVWHQPVIVLLKSSEKYSSGVFLVILSSLFTMALAVITKFIVDKFPKHYSRKELIKLLALLIPWTILIAGLQNIPSRFQTFQNSKSIDLVSQTEIDHAYQVDICFLGADEKVTFGDICFPKSSNQILLWGDSHAAALAAGFERHRDRLRQMTRGSCPPVLTTQISRSCRASNSQVFSKIDGNVSTIYLSADWRQYWNQDFGDGVINSISKIRASHAQVEIVLFGQVPLWNPPPLLLAEKEIVLKGKVVYSFNSNYEATQLINDNLRKIARGEKINFVDPTQYLCKSMEKMCISFSKVGDKYQASTNDGSHLNPQLSKYLMNQVFRY